MLTNTSIMRFKKTIKELLDKGASSIIDDELSVEELQKLAQIANKYNEDEKSKFKRHITIIARNKGIEDLKKIAAEGKGCVTIDVSGQ